MDKIEKQFQQIEMLKKRVSFLEKKIIPKNINQLENILEDFINDALILGSKTDAIYFDKKLNRKGIYSQFLYFYFLHYAFVNINLNRDNIRIVFEHLLNKIFLYDLTKNVVKQTSPFRDISYKYLKLKKEIIFLKTSITLQTIMDEFVLETIEFSLDFDKIHFDLKLQSYGVYARFLHFYFLSYSVININLNGHNVLEAFNDSLVNKISYDLPKYCINNKKVKHELVYKYLQFKKNK